jgi:hypothetical protein
MSFLQLKRTKNELWTIMLQEELGVMRIENGELRSLSFQDIYNFAHK